jgi:hypothetical protein
MPAVKPAPKPKDTSAAALSAALVLFSQNLEEIRRWYRGATYAGHQVGHVVMGELILAHVTTALAMALRGEHWSAPDSSP